MSFLRRFFTHLSTLFLALTILAGALVHATGSSLACPDWPLCLGKYFPTMTGAVLYEHSHRLIAGTTGILVWIAGGLFLASRVPRFLKTVAASLMFLIVVQAVLGGLTVLYQLPSWISTSHFLLAHLTFAGMFFLSWWSWNDRKGWPGNPSAGGGWRLLTSTVAVLFTQMGLGAWLRHIGTKGAPIAPVCDTFPWCEAKWVAAMTRQYLQTYWIHRGMAVLVTLLVVGLATRLLLNEGSGSMDFKLAYAASLTVVVQIVLGLLTVRSYLSVWMTMLHTAGALLLLTLLLWMNFRALRPGQPTPAT